MPQTIRIHCVTEPNFAENAYVIHPHDAAPCWIIDPSFSPSVDEILAIIQSHNLQPQALILTHGHIDHIAGVPQLLEALPNLPVYMAADEQSALTEPAENLSIMMGAAFRAPISAIHDLQPGQPLTLGETTWQILDTSGHSPAGRTLYCPAAAVAIVGDALFQGSIGRTDFHHSDHERLIRNINDRLLTLPDDTKIYSGHGPVTTIAAERRHNPFLHG